MNKRPGIPEAAQRCHCRGGDVGGGGNAGDCGLCVPRSCPSAPDAVQLGDAATRLPSVQPAAPARPQVPRGARAGPGLSHRGAWAPTGGPRGLGWGVSAGVCAAVLQPGQVGATCPLEARPLRGHLGGGRSGCQARGDSSAPGPLEQPKPLVTRTVRCSRDTGAQGQDGREWTSASGVASAGRHMEGRSHNGSFSSICPSSNSWCPSKGRSSRTFRHAGVPMEPVRRAPGRE